MRILNHRIPETQTSLEVFCELDENERVLPQFSYQTNDGNTCLPHGSLSDAIESAMFGNDELSILFQVAVCSQLAFEAYMSQRNNLANLPPMP